MPALTDLVVKHRGDPCELCDLPSGVTDNDECLGGVLEKVRDLRREYRGVLEDLAYYEERAKVNARVFASLTNTYGETLRLSKIKVRVTKPKKARVYWRGKELQEYSKENPDVLQFRYEKMSEPSVRIMVDYDD